MLLSIGILAQQQSAERVYHFMVQPYPPIAVAQTLPPTGICTTTVVVAGPYYALRHMHELLRNLA